MTSTAALNYPPPTTAPVRTPPGRTGALIGGGLLATAGAAMVIGGGVLLALGGSNGTFATGHHDVSTTTHALVSKVATIDGTADLTKALGQPRVRVDSDSGKPVFVGVARKRDVDHYLRGAEIDRVADLEVDPFALDKTHMSGDAHPRPPATQSFWVAQSTGTTAKLDWKVRDGNYRMVVMNADASRGVDTQSKFAVEIPHLGTLAIVALILGLVTIGGGAVLLAVGGRSRKPDASSQYAVG
jgi:hypothetical protein